MNAVKRIGDLALEAMLIEVSVTPKPGLVDKNNSGAHSDMDFFTFMKSAASLRSCFEKCADVGFKADDLKNTWPALRKIGLEAEKDMFKATNNVNTHKGEIFSLGILSASAGFFYKHEKFFDAERILKLVAEMSEGLCNDLHNAKTKPPEILTKGERVFIKYGVTGARGEAESGYAIVKNYGLPVLKEFLERGMTLNDAMTLTLLNIIAHNDDSNIISRHDLKTCEYAKTQALKIFNALKKDYDPEKILMLDRDFIARNISPSGSADLLAVTYFLHALEN